MWFFGLSKKDSHGIVLEEILISPVISNEIDTPDCTATEAVIKREEDQLNHLRRKFSNHEAQFAMRMNELQTAVKIQGMRLSVWRKK